MYISLFCIVTVPTATSDDPMQREQVGRNSKSFATSALEWTDISATLPITGRIQSELNESSPHTPDEMMDVSSSEANVLQDMSPKTSAGQPTSDKMPSNNDVDSHGHTTPCASPIMFTMSDDLPPNIDVGYFEFTVEPATPRAPPITFPSDTSAATPFLVGDVINLNEVDLVNEDAQSIIAEHNALPIVSADDNTEDVLRFEFVPGAKINSTLIYTIDEKQMYRRTNSYDKFDRYTCTTSDCNVSLKFFKLENVARKVANGKKHEHMDRAEKCRINKFKDSVKRNVMNTGGMRDPGSIYDEHAAR